MDLEIACPRCGEKIDLTRRLSELVAQESQKELDRRLAQERRQINEEMSRQAQTQARIQAEKLQLELEKNFQEKLQQKDLTIAEYQKQVLASQTKAQELEARLRQGSAQTKGILAEEDLFLFLQKHLPADRCVVEKHGQGKKGTDVIIRIQQRGERLGTIIVDDKWAGNWNSQWPEKVWQDLQFHKADFAYIAVNASAMPEELRSAGFGLAPCRRAGVRVWAVDRSNLELVLAILLDAVDKIIKMAEIKAVYGAGSPAFGQFQAYLTQGYEIDLREKAKHMSTALKALNDLQKKVSTEYEKAYQALREYWATENRVHQSIASSFGADTVKPPPQISFEKSEE